MGDEEMMNKKGAMLLRNVVFMIILFSGVMTLASIFVLDMASEYSNSNMTGEYNSDGVSNLGSTVSSNISSSVEEMRDATAPTSEGSTGLIGSFNNLGGVLIGAATIIGIVFRSPLIIGNALNILMAGVGVPTTLSNIIGVMVGLIIYAVIIFGIITAVLRGGKI